MAKADLKRITLNTVAQYVKIVTVVLILIFTTMIVYQ